jgi:VIT1/CCC1 family predicted Fe2+/Mn2+ transporter
MNEEQNRIAALLQFQQAEVDGAALYSKMAKNIEDERNARIIAGIGEDETKHVNIFESYTKTHLRPNRLKTAFYALLNKIFGFTFCIKLFERTEDLHVARYREFSWQFPELSKIMEDEDSHENLLIAMLDEERVRYTGSIVLGMSDALVELTGSLAGYTFAMQDTRLIAMAGLITGFSATLSMAASDYLSTRTEKHKNALKSSAYTGCAYLLTVVLLIFPYLLLGRKSYMTALGSTMCIAIGIIAIFNVYVSVVLDRHFRRGFLEMSCLSLGIACISFIIGIVIKQTLGIEL